MCTQFGRAILAKVADKDGQFIEWTREVDPTHQTPTPGVYYLNVDFFSDKTRELGLTIHKYRWLEGGLKNAIGTVVYFAPGIDLNTVSLSDAATSTPVQATLYNQSFGGFAYLLTPTQTLVATYNNGLTAPAWDITVTYTAGTIVTYQGIAYIALQASTAEPVTNAIFWQPYSLEVPKAGQSLVPMVDYWYQRPQSAVICQKTVSGTQLCNIPSPYSSVTLTDQDDYKLRPGIDYTFQGTQWVVLSAYTPAGSTITANMIVKINPYDSIGIMPENYLGVELTGEETVAPNQCFIHTPAGTFTNPIVQGDGSLLLPQLLQPGDWLRWEVRIDTGQTKAIAKKWEINNMVQVDPTTIEYAKYDSEGKTSPISANFVMNADPSELVGVIQTSAGKPLLVNGEQTSILAGLRLAIGDNVVVGDQCAIIINPTQCETYEVFGSKENLTFTLEVKANDLQTASSISEMLKDGLLITHRTNMEADGLTIFEISRSFVGQARDLSATAPSYVYTLSVTASADWKVYIPLIDRLTNLEINEVAAIIDYQGKKLKTSPRIRAFGSTQWLPAYS